MDQGRTGPLRPQFAGDSPRSLQEAGYAKAAAARGSGLVGPRIPVPFSHGPYRSHAICAIHSIYDDVRAIPSVLLTFVRTHGSSLCASKRSPGTALVLNRA